MSGLAADTPEELARELIRLTDRLTGLLERETALFDARNPLESESFQGEKSRLATLYRREIAAIKADPSRLEGATEASKAALRDATERFTIALTANGTAVDALRILTEGVVKAVADEAANRRDTLSGYGPGATSSARKGTGAPSIAINRSA
tara:strand:+ start:848 stop:1300 length:453 start_codon:yes stop_codon:yes gene_type:complete